MQLNRDGVLIHYEVHGSPTDKPPLLLTHGYTASSDMWRENIPVLSADRQVVVWDLRGHGESDAPDVPSLYSEDLTIGDMDALLDAVGAEAAVIGGMSLGGYLSLAYNIRHPDRVAGIVTCGSGPGFRRDEARAQWNATVEEWAQDLERRGLTAVRPGPEKDRARHRSVTGLVHATRGILAQRDPSVLQSLPSIGVPVLVVVGSEDEDYLVSAEVFAKKVPRSTKVVLDDAGHAANIDQADAFNEAVSAFLAAL